MMDSDIQADSTFQRALALHQAAHLDAARTLYEQTVGLQPRHFHALHMLGVIALETDQPQAAADYIGKAIDVDPRDAAAHTNHGTALQLLRQPLEALKSFDKALVLQPDLLAAHFNRGNSLRELAQYADAIASYDAALRLSPGYVEVHLNRGLSHAALKKLPEALTDYERALALQPDLAAALFNRGNVHREMNQWEAALADYDRAIAADGRYVEAYINRTAALRHLNRLDEALVCSEQAIGLGANSAEAHSNRVALLRDMKHLEAALEACNHALAVDAHCVEAHTNRAAVLRDMHQLEEALAACDRAIALRADHAEAHSNRAAVLRDLRQLEASLAACDASIAAKGDFADAHSNRAAVLRDLNRLEAALASCDRAISLKADHAEAHSNRGAVLTDLGRVGEALESFDRALAANPEYAPGHVNKALALLLAGKFDAGWAAYEWRWKDASGTVVNDKREFAEPRWDGDDSLDGKTILLHSEQGFGDTLQFCRYAAVLAERGARVILEVQPPLATLLATLPGAWQVIARGEPLPPFDVWCPLLSVPKAVQTRLPSIPRPRAYVKADGAKVAHWARMLGEKRRPRVGLMWSGNALHANDGNRSVPFAQLIEGLPAEFQYVSLQKDVREGDREALRACPGVIQVEESLVDFSDTAALCECVDLVVSVDTSVAHLSAALGRPTWILLPSNRDWRWLLERGDSPWYPTARLYRQDAPGDWRGVLQRLAADLRATLAQPAPDAQREQAFAAHERGDLSAARSAYGDLLRHAPDDFAVMHALGMLDIQEGRYASAEVHLEQVTRRYPSAPAFADRGNALCGLSRFDAAVDMYDAALALDANTPTVHLNRGVALQSMGRASDALAAFDAALMRWPNLAEASAKKALLLLRLGRWDEALHCLEGMLAFASGDAAVHLQRAMVLHGLARHEEALAGYAKVLELDPGNADARFHHGKLLATLDPFGATRWSGHGNPVLGAG